LTEKRVGRYVFVNVEQIHHIQDAVPVNVENLKGSPVVPLSFFVVAERLQGSEKPRHVNTGFVLALRAEEVKHFSEELAVSADHITDVLREILLHQERLLVAVRSWHDAVRVPIKFLEGPFQSVILCTEHIIVFDSLEFVVAAWCWERRSFPEVLL
jgi:hypothetical protein